MADAPVLLIACLKQVPMAGAPPKLPPEVAAAMKSQARISGSSIYPAVQNIILACRGLGLGTVLTTIHTFFEDEVKQILGLPPEVQTYALMPIRISAGKVRTDQAAAGERGRVPGQVRPALEGLSVIRARSSNLR